jgi:hypothetical protein
LATVTFVSETAPPSSESPPPVAATPPEMVRPTILTFALASTVKMRKSGVPAALLRATVSFDAPGPSMSVKPVVLLRSGRAELSVIVPATEKLIVLLPVVLSTWVMTNRRSPMLPAPVPVSPRLLTVQLERSVRGSSNSTVLARCRRRR